MSESTSSSSSINPLKRRNFKAVYILLALAVAVAIGSRVYASYVYTQEQTHGVPKLALNTWIGDLRAYHMKTGTFPENLIKLEDVVWRPRRIGKSLDPALLHSSVLANGDRIYMKNNYAYVYGRSANPHICSVWAIPIGDRQDDANTIFVIVTLTSVDVWKGAIISREQYNELPHDAIPTNEQMARLGMAKQMPTLSAKQSGNLFQRLLPF